MQCVILVYHFKLFRKVGNVDLQKMSTIMLRILIFCLWAFSLMNKRETCYFRGLIVQLFSAVSSLDELQIKRRGKICFFHAESPTVASEECPYKDSSGWEISSKPYWKIFLLSTILQIHITLIKESFARSNRFFVLQLIKNLLLTHTNRKYTITFNKHICERGLCGKRPQQDCVPRTLMLCVSHHRFS